MNLSVPYDEDFIQTNPADEKKNWKMNRKPPQGSLWRVIISKQAKFYDQKIFIRYARFTDKKRKGAESRSRYYVKHGNPNYGNIKGLISASRRTRMKSEQIENAQSDINDFNGETLNAVSYDTSKH